MSRALLLDLDDTLLHNHTEDFLPPYFNGLAAAVADYVARKPFLNALRYGTQQMVANSDLSRTNEEVFWQACQPLLPVDCGTLQPILDQFYEETFPLLSFKRSTSPTATRFFG